MSGSALAIAYPIQAFAHGHTPTVAESGVDVKQEMLTTRGGGVDIDLTKKRTTATLVHHMVMPVLIRSDRKAVERAFTPVDRP